MKGAQVAAMDYAPARWPPEAYTIVGRVKLDGADISTDARSRRRAHYRPRSTRAGPGRGGRPRPRGLLHLHRPQPAHQQCLDVVAVEAWFRRRTDIEERIREAKLGAGLNRLPSGHAGVNRVWMWAADRRAISVMLRALTGISQTRGTARMARLRHELLAVPGRVISHAGQTTLRLPPRHQPLPHVLSRIRAQPRPA